MTPLCENARMVQIQGHIQRLLFKDQDKDKDYTLVLKESLRARTRTNITA